MARPGPPKSKDVKRRNLPPEPGSVSGRQSPAFRHILLVAAVIGFALLAYSNSFHAPFLLDNDPIILRDSRVHGVTADHIRRVFTGTYWELEPIRLYRPFTTLSYLFNYSVLQNGDSPEGYHWMNFALHAANIGLVYALGLAIFEQIPLALLLSLLWSVHPVLTESVTNMVGRADLLAAFGVLAGLLCYRNALRSEGRRKAAWVAAAGLAAAVGVFSKESGLVVVGVILLYDWAFVRGVSIRSRLPGYIAVAIPCVLSLFARAHAFAGLPYAPYAFTENPLGGTALWTSRITAVKVIGKYLMLLVWPARLSGDYSYNAIPLFDWRLATWEDAKAVLALLAVLAATAAAAWSYHRDRRVFFGIGFFFGTLLPTSNLIVTIGAIMAERFLYLPAIGFLICVVCVMEAVWNRLLARQPAYRYAAAGAVALLLTASALRTAARNRDWMDDRAFWQSAMEAAPGAYKPRIAVASNILQADPKNWRAAVEDMDSAMRILNDLPDSQNYWGAYVDAGSLYLTVGDEIAAAGGADLWYRKALAAARRGERILLAGAERVGQSGGLSSLSSKNLYLVMGRAYSRLSDLADARAALERGRASESNPDLLEELADVYMKLGDRRAAAGALVEALYADSSRTRLSPKLADLYAEIDPAGCAVVHTDDAKELNPDCPIVHNDICRAARNLAIHYFDRGQKTEAAESRRIAIQDHGCDPALLK